MHVHKDGEAYEVETNLDGGHQVTTVKADGLFRHPLFPDRSSWDATNEIVRRIKAGEITVDDIRRYKDDSKTQG